MEQVLKSSKTEKQGDYNPIIQKYFFDRRHVGPLLDHETAYNVKFLQVGTPKNGAVLWLWFKLNNSGTIEMAKFNAFGAPEIIAAGAWLCEWLTGCNIRDIQQLTATVIKEKLQLNPLQSRAALLVEALIRRIVVLMDSTLSKIREVNHDG